ncbi:MAG: ABC transporter ATP-binding protein/permease [Micrococcales bacterium]|nr:ABC transporter ATP-binding protein/permease [Micrococcales bacterium]
MRTLGRILASTRELTPLYVGIVVCSVLTAATALATPFLLKHATDTVVAATQGQTGGAVRTVLWLAAGLLLAELANSVVTNIGGYLGDTMSARLRAILSQRYYDKLLSLPQRYFDNEVTGTVISRLTRSITGVTDFLQTFANNFFPMLLTVVAVLGISAYYYLPLTILLAIIFPAYMLLTTMTSRRWLVHESAKNTEIDSAGGRFAEVIGQIRVVKSFVQERRERDLFERHYDRTIAITREQSRYWHLMDTGRRGFLNLVFFGVYALIFVRTARGLMTVGDMVLLLQLVAMAKQPVGMMSFLVDHGQRAVAGSVDYFKVMEEQPERELAAVGARATSGYAALAPTCAEAAAIDLERVSFGYEGGQEVIRDVSFSVAPGKRVALVSESGGGKTTLVSLLLGLYRPDSGRLLLCGHDVAELPLEQVRASVGVVFQDASLFSGTIRENIAYGRPDATDEEIVEAATKANAHAFISKFEQGYDQLIGERGLKLSGGQRQRIAVARAMLKDAPVLVLDEATSALDTKAERLVQRGLDELMADRTTLIIAHRLSTISSVDTIVTLRDGQVDEIGSPADLATTGGIYSELLALQASASKQDRKRLRDFDITG